MGSRIGKVRSNQDGEAAGSSSDSRRISQPRLSFLKIIRRKSRGNFAAVEDMPLDDKDPDGWFPASRVFPEEPEFREHALSTLRAWYMQNESQNYLPPLKDLHLLLFAHSCLKDLEEAKLCMTKYYTSMVDLPFLFSDWSLDDEAIQQCFNTIYFTIMPVENPDGYTVMIMQFRNAEPEQFHFKDAARAVLMTLEAFVSIEGPPKGLFVIMDVNGMRMGHFAKMHIHEVKQFLNLVQDVLPIIMHEIDAVNCNYLVPLIMAAIKPFMTASNSDMLKIYTTNDLPIFLSRFPKSCLPGEYGGDLESLETYHQENLDRVNKLVPYWQERQTWIDSRRLHRKTLHSLHGTTNDTSSTGTSRPARATTPS